MNLIHENKSRKLSVLPLSIILSLCSVSTSYAYVMADSDAPEYQQADIKADINHGVMKTNINIQSPDSNGLSHNKYTKFDVLAGDSIVLNNMLSTEYNGNPLLKGAAAKIILNEVRSNEASTLAGNIHLAGQDAHVIIANPSGIDCNGCSFTNMSHLALTTGAMNFSHYNKLLGFKVTDGNININERGLVHQGRDAKSAYLDLFAEKVNIKGKLKADDVLFVAGKHWINLAKPGQKMEITQMTDYSSTPDHFTSVDVSDIGGMHANKIYIRAEGNIKNSNTIQSAGLLQIVNGGKFYNSGKVTTLSKNLKTLPVSALVYTENDKWSAFKFKDMKKKYSNM
uniref:filamentous hemagglutinin N-terminal domain-containing protein n=1 Tax=Yersinia frederiksenii TaxID=29484 RepID=UPI001F4C2AAF|nr:filamentous hemagglutinin N-terminal domain-containing protein [Yersinia frederiksenii]ULG20073.1 hypothetical protein 49p2_00068 [Yersinia frederiksenii]